MKGLSADEREVRRAKRRASREKAEMSYRAPEAEPQELFCHACNQNVMFRVDLNMNGNHVLNCPTCGHEHCRVVVDGHITGDRWDSRNGPTYLATTTTIVGQYTSATSPFTRAVWFASNSTN